MFITSVSSQTINVCNKIRIFHVMDHIIWYFLFLGCGGPTSFLPNGSDVLDGSRVVLHVSGIGQSI